MDKLAEFLINNAETIIGSPVRVSQGVMEMPDCGLYLWYKMGMNHEKLLSMLEDDKNTYDSIAPAAHVYVLNKEELESVKSALDRAYIELKMEIGSLESNMWYLLNEYENGWHLYQDMSDCGALDSSAKEVSCPKNLDEAMNNLIVILKKKFDVECSLARCIVLPFGCPDKNVYRYARSVSFLGNTEFEDFKTNSLGVKV